MQSQNKVDAATLATLFAPHVTAKNSRIETLAGDVSSRRYHRVHGERQSFVLQEDQPFAQANSHAFICAQKLLVAANVRVPEIVAMVPERGWILLEDVGDEMLQLRRDQKHYRQALDAWALWSARLRANGDLARQVPGAPHFAWFFDENKLQAEMEFTGEHLLAGYLNMPAEAHAYVQMMAENSRWLAARPRFFCHRDFHSRNVMVHNDEAVIIDFQDARMGPLSYDLVSLLWDPYVTLTPAQRTAYQKHALTALQAQGVALPDAFAEEVERMKLQRLLKAAGSYAGFFRRRGRSDYLPNIGVALTHAQEALRQLAQLGGGALAGDKELAQLLPSLQTRWAAILKA